MLGNIGTFILIILIAVVVVWLLIRLLSRAYIKTTAATAFVRTGGLGNRTTSEPLVVVNGAAWVFGFLHRIKWLSLETMAVSAEHRETNALITNDPQYVDFEALFFVRVGDQPAQISLAARTIGGEVVDEESVVRVVKPKINGAVRDIAATFSLNDLLEKRIDFVNQVKARLQSELGENGLMVESVSIVTMRPTVISNISTDDILGAQVARASAEVIEQALTARNRLERDGALERARQDAQAQREQLGIEEEIEKERAERMKNIAVVRANEEAAAQVQQEQKRKEAEQARILAERALREETLENERVESLLREQIEQAIAKEKVLREEALALAEEERQKRVAEATAEKLRAITKQIEADTERERVLQEATRVIEKLIAEREAEIDLLNTKLETDRLALETQSSTETEARRLKAIAEAERDVEETKAKATRTRAEAEREAAKLEAEGERDRQSASGLAQVQVELERLKVMQQEAETLKARMLAEAEGEMAKSEAMASNNAVARDLELARLRADVEKAIETARAEALGEAISGMNMNLIGDAGMAERMLQWLSTVQTAKQAYDVLPDGAKSVIDGLAKRISPDTQGADGDNQSDKMTIMQATGELIQHIQAQMPEVIADNPTLSELAVMLLESDAAFAGAHSEILQALQRSPNLRDVPLQTAMALAQNWLGEYYEEDDSQSIWL